MQGLTLHMLSDHSIKQQPQTQLENVTKRIKAIFELTFR